MTSFTFNIPLQLYWYVNQAYKKEIEAIERKGGVKVTAEMKLTFEAHQKDASPNDAFSEYIDLVQKCSAESTGFTVPLKNVGPEEWKDALKIIQRPESKLLVALSSEEMTISGPRESQDLIKMSLNGDTSPNTGSQGSVRSLGSVHQTKEMARRYLSPKQFVKLPPRPSPNAFPPDEHCQDPQGGMAPMQQNYGNQGWVMNAPPGPSPNVFPPPGYPSHPQGGMAPSSVPLDHHILMQQNYGNQGWATNAPPGPSPNAFIHTQGGMVLSSLPRHTAMAQHHGGPVWTMNAPSGPSPDAFPPAGHSQDPQGGMGHISDEAEVTILVEWLEELPLQKKKKILQKTLSTWAGKSKFCGSCTVVKMSDDGEFDVKIQPSAAVSELKTLIGQTMKGKDGASFKVLTFSMTLPEMDIAK